MNPVTRMADLGVELARPVNASARIEIIDRRARAAREIISLPCKEAEAFAVAILALLHPPPEGWSAALAPMERQR